MVLPQTKPVINLTIDQCVKTKSKKRTGETFKDNLCIVEITFPSNYCCCCFYGVRKYYKKKTRHNDNHLDPLRSIIPMILLDILLWSFYVYDHNFDVWCSLIKSNTRKHSWARQKKRSAAQQKFLQGNGTVGPPYFCNMPQMPAEIYYVDPNPRLVCHPIPANPNMFHLNHFVVSGEHHHVQYTPTHSGKITFYWFWF